MPFLTDTSHKNQAIDLFLALQTLSVTRFFPSSNGRWTLHDKLFLLDSLIASDNVDVNFIITLLEDVIEYSPDEVVLNTLFTLVATRATTPTTFSKAALDMPFKSPSSS
jgi:hypothetical protein